MATARVATVLVGLALVAGCSSTTSPDERCTERTEWGEHIASHATVDGGGTITPVETWSIPSSEHVTAEYVAMSFTVPGVEEPTTGVWLVEAADDGSVQAVLSVDAVAKSLTDWLDAAESQAAVTYPNDDTRAVETCIKG